MWFRKELSSLAEVSLYLSLVPNSALTVAPCTCLGGHMVSCWVRIQTDGPYNRVQIIILRLFIDSISTFQLYWIYRIRKTLRLLNQAVFIKDPWRTFQENKMWTKLNIFVFKDLFRSLRFLSLSLSLSLCLSLSLSQFLFFIFLSLSCSFVWFRLKSFHLFHFTPKTFKG